MRTHSPVPARTPPVHRTQALRIAKAEAGDGQRQDYVIPYQRTAQCRPKKCVRSPAGALQASATQFVPYIRQLGSQGGGSSCSAAYYLIGPRAGALFQNLQTFDNTRYLPWLSVAILRPPGQPAREPRPEAPWRCRASRPAAEFSANWPCCLSPSFSPRSTSCQPQYRLLR